MLGYIHRETCQLWRAWAALAVRAAMPADIDAAWAYYAGEQQEQSP